MKAVILCGGRGTRLGEHGRSVPKALVQIGGKPIIWHLMSIFAHYGVTEFVLCLGYLGDEIRDHFDRLDHDWTIECVETGLDTNTGGRLKRVQSMLDGERDFFVTYGDGLADVKIDRLLQFHREHDRTATITTVHPYSNFGIVDIDDEGHVVRFREKPLLREWINGGYFVFDQRIFDVLGEDSILEREPFERLANDGQMLAFRHEGFWKCMDTFKDNLEFEEIWQRSAPWKVW